MVSDDVGPVFAALADATRRDLVARLTRGPATVSELARPLTMSLSAVLQHVAVLADCGLVRTEKVGRTRTCHLVPTRLRSAEDWLAAHRVHWDGALDRLGTVLDPAPPEDP